MASTQSKFKGWSFHFDESEGTARVSGKRGRRRRGVSEDRMFLRREADGLEVRPGQSLVVNDPADGERSVMLVRSVDFGIEGYIEVIALGFLTPDEVEEPSFEVQSQELFLTATLYSIRCEDIIENATVLNEANFAKIVIDDSNRDRTFICRRGYDHYYGWFSECFDIDRACQCLAEDHDKGFELIKSIIVKTLSSATKRRCGPTNLSLTPEPDSEVQTAQDPKGKIRKNGSSDKWRLKSKRIKLEEVPINESGEDDSQDGSEAVYEESEEMTDESDEGGSPSADDADFRPSYIPTGRPRGRPRKSGPGTRTNGYISTGRPRGRPRKEVKVNTGDDEEEDNEEDEDDEEEEDDGKYRKGKTPVKRGRGRPRKSQEEYSPIKKDGKRDYYKNPYLLGPKTLAIKKVDKNELTQSAIESMAELPCREQQFTDLFLTLEGAIQTESGACVYISGVPGTGKTATVRATIKELHKMSEDGELNKFDYVEINGMKLLTPQSAYEILYNKIDDKKKVPISGLAGVLEKHFASGNAKRPFVLLMDELDQLAIKSQAVMYNFFNWPTLSKSKLIVIAVANTMDLPERALTNKAISRLGLERFQFPSYKHEELVEIIKSRFHHLPDNVIIKDDAVEFAARKVASVSGDARRALKICHRAVEIAKENADLNHEGPVIVQAAHINKAALESTTSSIHVYLSDMSLVGKLFLVALLSKKRKSGLAENVLGEVIDEMKQLLSIHTLKDKNDITNGDASVSEILYKDFIIRPRGIEYVLNELVEGGVILVKKNDTIRNTMVKLDIADDEITSVFRRDKSLKPFSDIIGESST